MKRNLTVQLDEQTIRDAKAVAAHRGTSVSGLVAQQIRQLAVEHDRYERAKQAALELMADVERAAETTGPIETAGPRSWAREDIYEERLGRYGR